MSPPSPATAGRTRVSSSSLMVATVSASLVVEELARRRRCRRRSPRLEQRLAGHEVLHDGAEDRRLEVLPFAVGLGHGDEVGAEEHAGDARRWRTAARASGDARRRRGVADVERAVVQARLRPGRNFSVAGFGVASVWMNIGLLLTQRGFKARRSDIGSCVLARVRMMWAARSAAQACRCSRAANRRADLTPARRCSSSLRCPGTMAIGIGKVAGRLAGKARRPAGPGPSLPVPAASTRMRDVLVLLDQLEDLLGASRPRGSRARARCRRRRWRASAALVERARRPPRAPPPS